MKKRIFAAIAIPVEARRKAAAYIEVLRKEFPTIGVGWERAEKLHLTLKFFGDANEKQLNELTKIIDEIASKMVDFELRISETGVFANVRNPRVLWIDVIDEQESLTKINNLIEAGCGKIGFRKDPRKFVPHLTIGCVREPEKARKLAQTHLTLAFEPVVFEVSEIVIYESILQPTGSIYSVVSKHKLK